MNKTIKKILFLDRSWPIRIWIWSAVLCFMYYLVKFSFFENTGITETDMYIMAYGLGSAGIYVLIFGFDWS